MAEAVDFLRTVGNLGPKQMSFAGEVCKKEYSLFAGARFPGKTYTGVVIVAWLNMLYASYGHEGIESVIATRDNSMLQARIIPQVKKILVDTGYGKIIGAGKDSGWGFEFKEKKWGTIRFIGLHDIEKQRGASWPVLFIDELGELLEDEFQYLLANVRFVPRAKDMNKPKPFPYAPKLFTCNMDSDQVGLHWILEYFVDKTFRTAYGDGAKQFADRFGVTIAELEDNPDKDAVEAYRPGMLMSKHVDAWAHAIWDREGGGRFPYKINNINPFEIPDHWIRVVGIDHGTADHTSAVWVAFDEDGNAIPYRHYYENELSVFDYIKDIKELSDTEKISGYYGDPSMWNRGADKNSIADHYKKGGLYLMKTTGARQPEVLNTIIERYLQPDNDFPNMMFFQGAVEKLTQHISSARWNHKSKNPENLIPHSVTHSIYSLGYALHGREGKSSVDNLQETLRKAKIDKLWRDKWKRMLQDNNRWV